MLVVAFVAGIVFTCIVHFSSPVVSIDLVNKSGKDIRTIDIIHEMGGAGDIRHQISDLRTGKQRRIKIWVPAESGYRLIVTFADQKQLTGGSGYIEPGYKVTETIKYDKIESNIKAFGGYGP